MSDTTVPADDESEPGKHKRKPLHQRVADGWNGLNVAGKVVVIGGAAITVAVGLVVLASIRASGDDPEFESSEGIPARVNDRRPTNASGGYYQCTHGACSKKMDPRITTHDCCGRCRYSSYQDCWAISHRAYDGPGNFAHDYFETLLFPGVCATCEEPRKGHWVLDGGQTRVLVDQTPRPGS
ncbi:hypothetical protein [Streptomyces sp. NPDC090053]|uniref:hypothetical protein n=1 Tax=Streptomyces sp. NPDC090053 TaxID=3365932 RepID=UPI00380CE49F